MANLPQLGHSNKQLADALKQLSAVKYGRPRAVVEKEIFDRLTTQEVPKPAFGRPNSPALGGGFSPPAPKPAGQGSFLDDWLAKRRAQDAKLATNPALSQSAGGVTPVATPANSMINDNKHTLAPEEMARNISSKSIDSKEVDSIAQRLKETLKADEKPTAPNTNIDKQSGPTVTKKGSDGVLMHDDTIHIDNEGNLTSRTDKP